jgi:uncharacterized protein
MAMTAERPLNVLVVTKGHPFKREPFFAIFDEMPGVAWTHVEQPAAQLFFRPEHAAPYDAFVLYDMPGIEFRRGARPRFLEPPPEYVEGFRRLLAAGHGFVFLHHALAGWPAWPEYAEILGGRFHYLPATLRDREWPDSGYRFDVRHRASVVAPGHPVVDGLADGFTIEDELYLAPIFEEDVVPLLRSDFDFVDRNFYSAALAVEQGRLNANDGWQHPPGSNLIAWTRRVGASPIVYIQCGDGPSAFANDGFRRLLANAIRWVASEAASAR